MPLHIFFRTANGKFAKQYTDNLPDWIKSMIYKDPKKITAHQHDLNNRFAKAVTQASEILQAPEQRAECQTQLNA